MFLKILGIGDTHIPDRASGIPGELLGIINSGIWDAVVFTGDLTGGEVLNWVKSLSQNVYVVKGNMDYIPLPKTAVFDTGFFKVGVHHGDRVYPRGNIRQLSEIAVRLGARILFSGHTHSPFIEIDRERGVLHLNPGSLTGVWGGGDASMVPSLMIVELKDSLIEATIIELKGGEPARFSRCIVFKEGNFNYC